MADRVLILGDPHFRDRTHPRDDLDAALVNRLPDVVIVTMGGPGLPALAASLARSRGRELVPVLADRIRYPGCAEANRDERLVELADAVVAVGESPDELTRLLLARLRAKDVPVRVVGVVTCGGEVAEVSAPTLLRGLPDRRWRPAD